MSPGTATALSLTLAATLIVTTPAAAAPLRDAVRVEGSRCVSADALTRAISTWRGTPEVAADIVVTVTEGPGTRARFVVQRAATVLGERDIDAASASCRELGDALALLIAVALDAADAEERRARGAATPPAPATPTPAAPQATSAQPPVPPTAAPAAAPAAAPPPAPPSPPRPLTVPSGFGAPPDPLTRSRLALEVTAAGGAAFDFLPGRAALVTAALGLRLGPPQGLAGLLRAGLLATTTALVDLGDGQAETQLTAGRLDACALWMPARAGLEACAGLGAGWLRAQGIGFDIDRRTGAPWMAVAARLAGRLTLAGPLGAFAGVDALVPVLAPRIEVESPERTSVAEVTVPPVGVGMLLGLAVTFP